MNTFDLESRELCPDGTCIGLIGANGQCRECGALGPVPYRGRRPGADPELDSDDDDDDDELDNHDELASASLDHDHNGESAAADDNIESRQLCPDEMCIGVIGDRGHCKECGTSVR